MHSEIRSESELVSVQTLIKSTLIAVLLAGITLLIVILPAEYNIDPTGVGSTLGLTLLSPEVLEIQQSVVVSSDQAAGSVMVELGIPAQGSLEYKLTMKQHKTVTFEWATNGTPLYVDMHGEPDGDTTGFFRSYVVTTATEMKGSLDAAFDGTHGWYWKNNSDRLVPVLLIVQGEFEVIENR